MRPITPGIIAGWIIVAVLAFGPPLTLPALPSWLPWIVSQKATAATYVYEKDTTAIPTGVATALNTLNRKGIVATVFEQDTLDGNGKTPAQYVVPLDAAKIAGLPSLVVQSGVKVLKVVKDPKTEADVLKAVP